MQRCSCRGLDLLSISTVALNARGTWLHLWLLWQKMLVLWQATSFVGQVLL
jgi:hypothetical protein